MTILLVLIPLGIALLVVALAAFVWAVRSGQFEDLEGEGERILFDDEPLPGPRPRGGRDSIEGPG
jgi:cbb3-type cytochrome oxidase maturation protein